MRVVSELMACMDCMLYVANGDIPDDYSPDSTESLPELIQAHLGLTSSPQQYLVCGDSEHDDEFSWRPCECCGSRLGGSRHALAILESEA